MAGYRCLIPFLSLLLFGCAQVGVISGGDKDTFAPKPIAEKVQPPNATTNFTVKNIEIPFDEYFTLNSPTENIQLIPPHATIDAKIKGKSLLLSWDEDLQPNTTYAIYLNKAVVDLTERNDSIMQYVFSTGTIIDSLSYQINVVDAETNSPVSGVVVGLFDLNRENLLNFAQTNRSGVAKLKYVRANDYQIIAFKDENGNLMPEESEQLGFLKDSIITIDSAGVSAFPIRVFSPKVKPEITTLKFEAPASFLVTTNFVIEEPVAFVDGAEVDSSNITVIDEMNLRVYAPQESISNGKFVLRSNNGTDTTTYRVLEAQKEGLIKIGPAQKNLVFAPSEPLTFRMNDLIQSVDTSLISVFTAEDSTAIVSNVTFARDEFTVSVPRGTTQQIILRCEAGAFQTKYGRSSLYTALINLNSSKKYGSISLDVKSYATPVIVQVMQGTTLVRSVTTLPSEERLIIQNLNPGEYTFNVIRDENNNRRWDIGNLSTRTQPEQIDVYSKPTKVRANWEVEVELIPTSEQ